MILAALWLDVATPAHIRGRVEDMQGAVILDAEVKLTSPQKSLTTPIDAQGRFFFDVPPGVYNISVEGYNFLSDRRAALQVKGGEVFDVVLRPVFRAPSDQSLIKDAKLSYKLIPIEGEDRQALVRYEQLKASKQEMKFMGNSAMLSFQTVAVYGGDIRCRRDRPVCVAKGSSLVDVGFTQLSGSDAEVDLIHRTVSLLQTNTRKRTVHQF